VIYLDSSVVLARLLAEARQPPIALWDEACVSSRLLEYEIWNRILARGLGPTHSDEVRATLREIDMVSLTQPALRRALEPFPIAVRTLDGLHLATIEFLRGQGDPVELASYDNRLVAVAQALDVPIFPL
jgi:hypothetical protein